MFIPCGRLSWLPVSFLLHVKYKLSYRIVCRRFVSKDLVQNQSFPVTPTQGGSWELLRKSAVESTTLAQPFCVNLPQHFHFIGEYIKLYSLKTMGTRGKINAIWWNIKTNLQKLADIGRLCGYELPTNWQNFTQKDTTKVKIFQKSFTGGGLLFFWNTLIMWPTMCGHIMKRCGCLSVRLSVCHMSYLENGAR